MYTLLINTADNTKISIGLRKHNQEDILLTEIGSRKTQVVLPLIDELLKQQQLTLQDLTGIEVVLGPGSFTGLRVGITIANTLASALNLPINGGLPGKLVEPIYE